MLVFRSTPGMTIENACKAAVKMADERHERIVLDFNGVKIRVSPGNGWAFVQTRLGSLRALSEMNDESAPSRVPEETGNVSLYHVDLDEIDRLAKELMRGQMGRIAIGERLMAIVAMAKGGAK
jgi:hypothetical protein